MVVAIVGFGGLGKTTLAKQVFDKIAGNFGCTAFVPVSRNPDINKVLRDILLDFNSGDSPEALRQLDKRQLINKLRKYIEGKRYLVAVDDIWSKDAWIILDSALFRNNHGSRIIVTTRKNDVAEECCPSSLDHVYRMDPLDKNDSENLFVEKAFGRKGCPPNLRDVCGKILKKCAGSPLAIVTLSGLLRNKVTVSQCEEVLHSLSNAVPEDSDVDAMRKILSFSYFDLPHHLRTCLLYFSMFPEDIMIRRKRLLNMWIAEGFVHCSDGRNKTEIAGHYFAQLISRNLIQPVDIQYDGQAQACRVHDTILDFIVSKSLEENFVSFLGYQLGRPDDKVRRLSIHYQKFQDGAGLAGQDLSHVRSLCIFGEPLHKSCTVSLRGLTNLRVFDARNGSPYYTERDDELFDVVLTFPHIDFDVSESPQLKYLDMYELMPMEMARQFYTREVLTGIANLQYLETLDLRSAMVKELPSDIYKLQQLVRLFIRPRVILATGIGRMEALEELKEISIYSFYSLEFLQELAQLTKLRSIHIRMEDGQIGLEQELVLISSIYKLSMCNLHSLKIEFFNNCDAQYGTYALSLQYPLQSLRKFQMRHIHFTKIPNWMGSLNHLEKLALEVGEMEQKDLDILGELPSLLYLFFAVIECPKEMLTFRESTGFHCLKYLDVGNILNGAVMLEFQAGSMPRLEHLELAIHTSDSTLCGCFVSGIEHLNMLTRVRILIFKEPDQDGVATDVESAITSAVDKLPNNPTLRIEVSPVFPVHNKAYNMRGGLGSSRRGRLM
ncbi:disease resistance protein RGA5-like isoform X2 [Panicum virgatum]|uniref:disease resistance protein RGA5-like isoform X2 n=1 Tax=Panicum virgatum TaxID=38727 RepID=UPI0019D5F6FE|nr:disease resistance protein RGA5-like isoform X2 [Panicum virgatum]XP_039790563.1 disease resistance protein RGA5-like isoform X2 [Panicum virgatum]